MSAAALSTSFIEPTVASGGDPAEPGTDAAFGANNRGVFTLLANTTYYYLISHADATVLSATLHGDAAIVITSATIEDSNWAETEAPLDSNVTGQWLATDTGMITSSKEGTGWTNTSDVGAASGGNAGAVAWNIVGQGARRTRIAVVVGGTGGQVRVGCWGRE